ncbi:MAG: hypothetical protein WAZ21_00105 [Candidatus Saccharimonadales bacterium]
MDILTILFPIVVCIFYAAIVAVIVKLVIFSYQIPKRLQTLEKRIKQLEDRENK